MGDKQTQYLAAVLGDIFDSLRSIAKSAERIAGAQETLAELETRKIAETKYLPPD